MTNPNPAPMPITIPLTMPIDDAAQNDDPWDVRLALSATGLLREFNQAGVLDAADVHVAVRLGALSGETDETVLLALALAVRGVRGGSVCVDLAQARQVAPTLSWPPLDGWVTAVRASVLTGPGRPMRWDLDLLYLDRYWRQEDQVHADLLARETQPPPVVDKARLTAALDRLFAADAPAQRAAAKMAATRWTTVLGGGPGTGKTTTVARMLALLLDQPGPVPRVALAAPTGKAAARLQEAVQQQAEGFDQQDRDRLGTPGASTLHRLLGTTPGRGTRFRYNRTNRLPFDLVVVDETSMVSLTLMARLLEALRPDARLVLVGDPDQLASVEAGAVLADLVTGLTGRQVEPDGGATPVTDQRTAVVVLDRIWRFHGGVAQLATAVRDGDVAGAAAVLSGAAGDVSGTVDGLREDVVAAATAVRAAALLGDADGALHALEQHRLLCAHRTGPFGVQAWSLQIERWLRDVDDRRDEGEWYFGRPLLVTANDQSLRLFNGDTGVVVREPDGTPRAVFARGASVVRLAPTRLYEVQTVHAMTVHRSQGSQFARVSFVLPPEDSPLLTRELLYTGLTRAREFVRVIGTPEQLRGAIERRAARASGLGDRLRLS
jgi:exodeoxyribonuclease V alpha subunit